ncbi:MAG: response regulator [Deltaproteobacteria bacterium]|nr:response regulator [Deltaproteobacteria bacterium]
MAHILVVDDEQQVRLMLRKKLEAEGHHVSVASEGGEALGIVKENPIEVAITDLLMPGKDGLETIIDLRRDHPGVMIIAISGGGVGSPNIYLDAALRLGAHRTFSKPIALETLFKATRELVSSRS